MVENLLHWFMGDRRPCLTAVNTVFLRFGITQTTLGGLLQVLVANFIRDGKVRLSYIN